MKWALVVLTAITLLTGTATAFDWWHQRTAVWECVGVKGRAGYLECQETRPASPRYGFELERGQAILKRDGRMLFMCTMKEPAVDCRDFRTP